MDSSGGNSDGSDGRAEIPMHTSPEGGASEKKVSHPRIKRDFYF